MTNDHLYEALKVLAMEKPGEFRFDNNFFARFGIDPVDEKQVKDFLYRKNPFTSIVNELTQQYSNPHLADKLPFIQTGFNPKGELTATMVCSSDQTSLDGKHPTGNTNAYIHRVKREFNVSITPLAVNSFL